MKIIEKDNLKIVVENNTATIFTSLTGPNGQSVPVKGSIDVLATFDSGSGPNAKPQIGNHNFKATQYD